MIDLVAIVQKLAENDAVDRASGTGELHLNSRVDLYSDGSGLWVRTSVLHRDGQQSIPHSYSDPAFLSGFHITQAQLAVESVEHLGRLLSVADTISPAIDLWSTCQALCRFESISAEGFNVTDVCLHVYSDGSGFVGLTWTKTTTDETRFQQLLKGVLPSPESLKFADLCELKTILRLS